MKGKYIVLEGIDGCGKTWHAKRLMTRIQQRYPDALVVLTREPGSVISGLGEGDARLDIRKFVISADNECAPTTLEMLLQADRAQHTFKLLDLLRDGAIVVSDRSFISGLAYGKANGHHLEGLLGLADFGVDVLPDHTIFLDCSVSTAFERMNHGTGAQSREELRGQAFMGRVRKNFLDLLFSPVGRDTTDLLRQFDDVCTVHRISTESRTTEETAARIDQVLGLV